MKMLLLLLQLALLLLQSSSSVTALKFVVAPIHAISPTFDLMGVAAELQNRGHSVLVVCSHSAKEFARDAAASYSSAATADAMQYHGIAYQYNYTAQQQQQQQQQGNSSTGKNRSGMMRIPVAGSVAGSVLNGGAMILFFKWAGGGAAEGVLGDAALMQRLRDFQPDAVMAVGMPASVMGDNLACLLSHALGGVPFIDINGNALLTGPTNVPQFGAGLTPTDLQTLRGYTLNLASFLVKHTLLHLSDVLPFPVQKIRAQHGLPRAAGRCWISNAIARVRGVKSRKCEALLEVTLGSWLIEYAQPQAANQVMVGPGSPKAARPITSPPEVAEFINSASSGLVLVSFGTMPVVGAALTATDIVEMAHAFVGLAPVRFLWAMKQQGLPPDLEQSEIPLGDNCMIVPWVDQNDVLGHPNSKAFVSHSGLHSVYEAAFHGVPLVSIGFHFESVAQALKLAHRGAAVISRQAPAFRSGDNQQPYTRQAVTDLLNEVLLNSSYTTAAKALSHAVQGYAQQRHPYQRAADEVELALATQDAVAGTAGNTAHATGQQRKSSYSAGSDGSGGTAHERTGVRRSQTEL